MFDHPDPGHACGSGHHPATHRRRSAVPHAGGQRHPDQPVADI